MSFLLRAFIILVVGYFLMRFVGKKTASEMTGIEIITLLAMASMIGHGVGENGLWKTILVLCLFIAILTTVQYLSIKFDFAEKWIMGKAILVIQNGQVLSKNLKKLRMSVDQLESKLREQGIASITDVKTGTIEISGQLGYELVDEVKPVTFRDLQALAVQQQLPPLLPHQNNPNDNLFNEVIQQENKNQKDKKLNPRELK